MNIDSIHQKAAKDHPTQIGPPWHCWTCGAVVPRIVGANECWGNHKYKKPVDEWKNYIWYLYVSPECEKKGHLGCSARMGDAITPLKLYDNPGQRGKTVEQMDSAEREAIRRIKTALGVINATHGPQTQTDPVSATVWNVTTGAIMPEQAIREIHALIQRGIAGALAGPVPDNTFWARVQNEADLGRFIKGNSS